MGKGDAGAPPPAGDGGWRYEEIPAGSTAPGGGPIDPGSTDERRNPSRTDPGRRATGSRLWPSIAVLAAAALVVIVTGVVNHTGPRATTPTATSDPAPTDPTAPTDPSTPANPASPGHTMSTVGTPVTHPGVGPVLGEPTPSWALYGYAPASDGRSPVVARIDLATGTEIDTSIPDRTGTGPMYFLAGPGGAIIRPLDYVSGWAVTDDGRVSALDGLPGTSGPAVPGPRPGEVWVPDGTARVPSDATLMALADFDGRRLGPTIAIPSMNGFPSSDGAGGLLVTTTGGQIYDLTPEGQRLLLAGGRVLAAGPTGFVVTLCEMVVTSTCQIEVLDRSGVATDNGAAGLDGSGRPTRTSGPPAVHLDPAVVDVIDGSLSLDGHYLALMVRLSATTTTPPTSGGASSASGGVGVDLIDLRTGASRLVAADISGNAGAAALAWSPDSQRLFVATVDGIVVIAPGTQPVVTLTTSQRGVALLAFQGYAAG